MRAAGHSALEQALQVGTRMLNAALVGDWTSVADLCPAYDALLRQDHATSENAYATLLKLQRQHQDLLALTGQARESIAAELAQQRCNHRALNAYLSHP